MDELQKITYRNGFTLTFDVQRSTCSRISAKASNAYTNSVISVTRGTKPRCNPSRISKHTSKHITRRQAMNGHVVFLLRKMAQKIPRTRLHRNMYSSFPGTAALPRMPPGISQSGLAGRFENNSPVRCSPHYAPPRHYQSQRNDADIVPISTAPSLTSK